MNERKKWRKKAELTYRCLTEWNGGVLYFKGTRNVVPFIPAVPKPGKEAIGYDGAQPAPKAKRLPSFRIAAE